MANNIQDTGKVRPATATDAASITRFQQQMAKETEGITLDADTVGKGVSAVFEDPSRGIYYVLEVEGQVIASLLITYEWSEWRNGQVWWIQSVYVERDFRGQGIFKQLYAYIQSLATSDENICGIRLYVDNTNAAAQKVYQSIGMNGDHYKVYEWMKS
jgi:GNAT superfamily N-acetyltransferase